MSTVVVGVDGSPCADAAVEVAVDLASAFGDTLAVVFAAEPPQRLVPDEYREHRRALEEIGGDAIAAAAARAAAAGVEAETLLVAARPAQALLDVATERGARLIVVGTTSERPLTGVILGSVPHKLVHRSTIPVVVVPVPEEA